jgi:hypothetical protein
MGAFGPALIVVSLQARITMMRIALITLVVLVVAVSRSAADEVPRSLQDVISGINRAVARFNGQSSWMLRYQHAREIRQALPEDFPAGYPPKTMTNARKGQWLFNHEKQASLAMNNDPPGTMVDTWLCWKDQVCIERMRDRLWILPEPSVTAYSCFWFTSDMFLNAQEDLAIRSKDLKAVFRADSYTETNWRLLPRGIEAHGNEFVVRPNSELIDGFSCLVLERAGKDIIWVDPEHGFSVRRRQYFQSPGSLLFEAHHWGFEERTPGIWLPGKESTDIYNLDRDPPQYRGKIKYVRTNTLLEYRSNDVPDSLFEIPKPKKGYVTDYIRGMDYVRFPPSLEPFNAAVRYGKDDMRLNHQAVHSWLEWFIMVGTPLGMVLLVAQVWLEWRRVRARAFE